MNAILTTIANFRLFRKIEEEWDGATKLTLLPSKLREGSADVTTKDIYAWRMQAIPKFWLICYTQIQLVLLPIFVLAAAMLGIHFAETFSAAVLMRIEFLSLMALFSLFLIFISSTLALSIAVSYALPNAVPIFPGTLFLNSSGFAFSKSKRFFKWESIRAIRLKDYIYRGTIKSPVLELFVEPGKIGFLEKVTQKNGLQQPALFFDPVRSKVVSDYDNGLICLRLPLAMFGFENDLRKFLVGLRDNVHPETVECDLGIDSLGTAEDGDAASFTALWLSDLRSSNTNTSIGRKLESGHNLQNGRYVIDGILGIGGFSVVYSAQHKLLEGSQGTNAPAARAKDLLPANRVAIKEIVVNSGGTRTSKEAILKHIVSEIDLLRKLDHPNIVKCLDFFVENGKIYIVLEAFAGSNLRDMILETGKLSESQTIEIAIQSASILSYLHSRSKPVVHRDFTPDNLILRDHTVKLIDFNVAEEANASSSHTIVGKHCYLATEQWSGQFTPSGDLYQLGCTLHFLLTGADPEPLTQSDPGLVVPHISDGMRNLVRRLTEHDADDRYTSAFEVLRALEDMQENGSRQKSKSAVASEDK